MSEKLLNQVIFSPGWLALDLANSLVAKGEEVVLYTPDKVKTRANNMTADLSGFEKELKLRGYGYMELLKKHPLTFISLARQVQAELVAQAIEDANADKLDMLHFYANEEEMGIVFSRFASKPAVFTHHDPFNFTSKYRGLFPKYKKLNWISISNSQRLDMPPDTNWVGNVHHGIAENTFMPRLVGKGDYIGFMGRIIKPKGLHLAIKAAQKAGLKLKIAGKHYSSESKDNYWQKEIEPHLKTDAVEYVGYLKTNEEKQQFLTNAKALVVPSTWREPFGMVTIEALACGTPVIAFNRGATPEIINEKSGIIIKYLEDDEDNINALAEAFLGVEAHIERRDCLERYKNAFTLDKMAGGYIKVYRDVYNRI
jgi:glycosyltransferase involved in cell wall biosynthesis